MQKELARPAGESASQSALTQALRNDIDTIVVIYAENRAFDNLYGNFPGARGLREVIDRDGRPLPAYHPQVDRNGSVLPVLPPSWLENRKNAALGRQRGLSLGERRRASRRPVSGWRTSRGARK